MTTIKKILCAIDLDEGKPQRLRPRAQRCSCEQRETLHSSRGAGEEAVLLARARTPRTADQPAATCRARRRPGAGRRATRRSRRHHRAACQFQESRPRRPWIEPAPRLAAVQRGLCRGTCAPPRGLGSTDRSVGRSSGCEPRALRVNRPDISKVRSDDPISWLLPEIAITRHRNAIRSRVAVLPSYCCRLRNIPWRRVEHTRIANPGSPARAGARLHRHPRASRALDAGDAHGRYRGGSAARRRIRRDRRASARPASSGCCATATGRR